MVLKYQIQGKCRQKFNVAKMTISLFNTVENVKKGNNAGNQHFSLPTMFRKALFLQGSYK